MHYDVGDYASPQAALDAAEFDPCAIVEFPPALYSLAAPLVVHSETTVRAYGAQFVAEGQHRLLRAFRDGDSFAGYDGPHDITILGGTWDAQGQLAAPGTVVNAMNFCHARDITVMDATIRNVAGAHAIELSAVDGAVVERCRFEGFHNTGNRDYSESVQIGAPYSTATTDIGTWDATPCRRVSIVGCRMGPSVALGPFGAIAGDHVRAANVYHDGIRVIDCDVDGSLRFGIRPYAWRDFAVRGNTIRGTAGASIIVQHCRGGVVEGNVIRNAGSNAVNVSASRGVVVGGNVVNDTATNYGIWVGTEDGEGSEDVLVAVNGVRGGAAGAAKLGVGVTGSALMGNMLRRGSGGSTGIIAAAGPGTANRCEDNDFDGFTTNISNGSGTIATE
ncbi:MAG TPA: right-handed parallel beta-helix repeat-containing protein [Micromonosporaceae bacterium]